jgi:hypothetical protein
MSLNVKPPSHVSDGSGHPPRLVVYAHTWALLELPRLPHQQSWSFEEALDRVLEAGFQGLQGEPEHAGQVLAQGLRFAAGGRANTVREVATLIDRTAALGAECLTVHLGWSDESDSQVDALVAAVLKGAERRALPVYVETHRATAVQDLWRTSRLIERIPGIRFNGDYSHYYCAGEVPYRGFSGFAAQLEPVLERTCFFHGRVSNGQSMQVSIQDDEHAEHLEHFKTLWRTAMTHWLRAAGPGDLLPFVPELGPPSSGYAITRPDPAGGRQELSDRWTEMLRLKRIAEALFSGLTSRPAPAE